MIRHRHIAAAFGALLFVAAGVGGGGIVLAALAEQAIEDARRKASRVLSNAAAAIGGVAGLLDEVAREWRR